MRWRNLHLGGDAYVGGNVGIGTTSPSRNLEIGWSFDVNLPQRKYKITLAAIELLKVPAGEYLAYYFESEPKQIGIWISKDEHRLPLKIEGTGGMIGYKLLMREYSLPQQGVQNSK